MLLLKVALASARQMLRDRCWRQRDNPSSNGTEPRIYGTEAEDLIVRRLMHGIFKAPADFRGFYVDIGAGDPIRGSNTAGLYERGWRGLNIEPNTTLFNRFVDLRPDDVNVNIGVAESAGDRIYSCMTEPFLNGFLSTDVVKYHVENGEALQQVMSVECRPAWSILNDYLNPDVVVDLLNIDVELMEIQVIRSWPFLKWKPRIIVVEIHSSSTCSSRKYGYDIFSTADLLENPVAIALISEGYVFFSRIWHSCIFLSLSALNVKTDLNPGGLKQFISEAVTRRFTQGVDAHQPSEVSS